MVSKSLLAYIFFLISYNFYLTYFYLTLCGIKELVIQNESR